MALRLLITEVTDIHPGTYCVAGWDPVGIRMVRPLPDGVLWPRALLDQAGVAPGAAIAVHPTASVCAATIRIAPRTCRSTSPPSNA